nr:omega-hydroxypalmitate O-feruloyl transferase [Ipomoea trifida]
MAMTSIHVKEAVLVSPSEPTPVQVLPLSALDSQPFLRFTIEYLMVYKTAGAAVDRVATAARVKDALGRALVPYYPLAGRVRARPDGAGLEVTCRGQGAVFIEAASELTAAEFERAPRCGAQWRMLLSLYVVDVLKGAPPLVVQLTWLSDNAATLAVGFNHCLCDGIGSAEFLNFLAELAAGKRRPGAELKQKPVWDRHIFNPANFRPTRRTNSVSHHPEFNRVADVSNFNSRFSQERLTPTSVEFDRRKLTELKKLVQLAGKLAEPPCTSFEVLSAHVWRSWARALNLPQTQTLKLLFSVNVRHRVNPSLPGGYYGNAFVLGCAQATAKDLSEKGLGYATELIKRAKERVDEEYVREVVESVSSTRACPDSVGVLIMSQWSRLGLERVDFGLGRPVEVGPVICDRYCILLPVYDSRDAVKVNVAVPASAVDQYLYLLRNTCT